MFFFSGISHPIPSPFMISVVSMTLDRNTDSKWWLTFGNLETWGSDSKFHCTISTMVSGGLCLLYSRGPTTCRQSAGGRGQLWCHWRLFERARLACGSEANAYHAGMDSHFIHVTDENRCLLWYLIIRVLKHTQVIYATQVYILNHTRFNYQIF